MGSDSGLWRKSFSFEVSPGEKSLRYLIDSSFHMQKEERLYESMTFAKH